MSRTLAVDPGDKRIGIAVSDPTGTIARPLLVLEHSSRAADANEIVQIAEDYGAVAIVVGVPYDADGDPGPQARKSLRLVEALAETTSTPVHTWDESGSTQSALRMHKRDPLLDARSAAVVLQEYLDAQTV